MNSIIRICIFGLLLTAVESIVRDDPVHQADSSHPGFADYSDLGLATNVIQQIHHVLEHFRQPDTKGIPGVQIPDPMQIADSDPNMDQGYTRVQAKLRNVTLLGLSNFTIDHVSMNVAQMQVHIGLNFSQIHLKGNYSMSGKLSFMSISGNGEFYLNMIETYITAALKLAVNENGNFYVNSTETDCNVQSLVLHFENLFGGGFWSGISNKILNALSKQIFNSIKPAILKQLESTVTNSTNAQLSSLPAQPFLSNGDVSAVDVAIANAALELKEKFDPLPLPSQESSFKKNVFFFRVQGKGKLYNGYLNGLSTIHRTGDMILTFKNNTFEITVHMGFEQLVGGYKWDAKVLEIHRKGGLHFKVENLAIEAILHQPNAIHSNPELKEFRIARVDQLGIDLDGLGSVDFIVEFLSNFVTNVFKYQLSQILENQVKDIIQQNLNNINLPF